MRYFMKNRNIINYIRKLIISSLYIFYGNVTSDFSNYSNGILLRLSIGCNLIGIILIVAYMPKKNNWCKIIKR